MICKHCKNEISDESKFCGYCGKEAEPAEEVEASGEPAAEVEAAGGAKVCPACGKESELNFCPECGADLRNNEAPQEQPGRFNRKTVVSAAAIVCVALLGVFVIALIMFSSKELNSTMTLFDVQFKYSSRWTEVDDDTNVIDSDDADGKIFETDNGENKTTIAIEAVPCTPEEYKELVKTYESKDKSTYELFDYFDNKAVKSTEMNKDSTVSSITFYFNQHYYTIFCSAPGENNNSADELRDKIFETVQVVSEKEWKENDNADSDESDENEAISDASNSFDSLSEELHDAYWNYLLENFGANAENDESVNIAIYDINNDSTQDLIVTSGSDSSSANCYIVSYANGDAYFVDSMPGSFEFYETDEGAGIIVVQNEQGEETIRRLNINKAGDKLDLKTFSAKKTGADGSLGYNPIELEDYSSRLRNSNEY